MAFVHIVALCAALFCSSFAYAAQEGRPAPGFGLRDLAGGSVTLEQFKGKVLFLAFWAPWCMPCRDELPELDSLYRKYRNEGFAVIGISVESSASGVSSFLKKVPVTFPIVIDGSSQVAEAYLVSGLPASFLIDRTGVVHKRYRGFEINALASYEADIADLLKQK